MTGRTRSNLGNSSHIRIHPHRFAASASTQIGSIPVVCPGLAGRNFRIFIASRSEIGRICLFKSSLDFRSMWYPQRQLDSARTPDWSLVSSQSPELSFSVRQAIMTVSRSAFFTIAAVVCAVGLSGCCVTGVSIRKPCQDCQPQNYEPIPQGIGPAEPMPGVQPVPGVEPAPEPIVPPSPSTSKRNLGTSTTMLMHTMTERVKDMFER